MPAPIPIILSRIPLFSFCIGSVTLCSGEASAHIKWFCAFDVGGQPRGLENVLCPDFEFLVGFALVTFVAGCVLEGTSVGVTLQRALDRVTAQLAADSDLLIRAFCGFFFVALWVNGGTILTPELKTDSSAVSWLQLAIAASIMWRQTLPLAAFGIVFLFGLAIRDYGVFHLMDYPIFLGLAAYFALVGRQRNLFGLRPLDVARWATAITLMWASIEKWAYPDWSFPLFIAHPSMTLGYDEEFFMRAAGVIEFTLAFALVWTPLVRRAGAIILAGMFSSAIVGFGKIDAIGHAPIIAVLLATIADPAPAAAAAKRKWGLALAPASFAATLVTFLAFYYVLHKMLFGTTIT